MHAHQDVKQNTPHGFQVKFSKALNQDALTHQARVTKPMEA